jgi:hypothetical protein
MTEEKYDATWHHWAGKVLKLSHTVQESVQALVQETLAFHAANIIILSFRQNLHYLLYKCVRDLVPFELGDDLYPE